MHVENDGYEQLNTAIENASYEQAHMTTKAELIDYYQKTYTGRGKDGWKQHIVKDLAAQTGIKSKNLEKRFDTQRRGNPEKRNAGQYVNLGQTLPTVEKPKKTTGRPARVSFHGMVCIPSGKKGGKAEDCRERSFSAKLNPGQASKMKQGNFNPIFDAYGLNPGVIGSTDVYSVSVEFL